MTTAKKILLTALLLLSSSTSLFASEQKSCPGVHTWHHIFINEGKWQGALQVINEADHAWFVGSDCSKINSMIAMPEPTQEYGFVFDHQADFDVAYTMTFTQLESSVPSARFGSKVCVFVVTAKGPAQPDVTPLSYNGAKCDWKVVPGVGEDFYIG